MDILKTSIDWAKAELVSTPFFILLGVLFITSGVLFWQFGKTDIARAYILPMLIAGLLLSVIGIGLYFTNKARIGQFERDYTADATAFVASEILRAEKTLKEYKTIVFAVIPILIALCALLLFLVHSPNWRAVAITTLAMLTVILLIDGTAHARIDAYRKQLVEYKKVR